jgi:hypothetical protein
MRIPELERLQDQQIERSGDEVASEWHRGSGHGSVGFRQVTAGR